jgi:hypothetical protein
MTVQKFQAMQIGNQQDSELSNQNQVSQFTSPKSCKSDDGRGLRCTRTA